MMANLQSG
jgi:hypothetical protein